MQGLQVFTFSLFSFLGQQSVSAADLTKLEHLDIYSFLLQLCQLGLSGSLVLEQLHMLVPQLLLSQFQL